MIREGFKGVLVLNSDYDLQRGQAALAEGAADAISFGRKFLANPDLPYRFANGLALNESDAKAWFAQGAEGYVTYASSAR